jgi:hypothetical protein
MLLAAAARLLGPVPLTAGGAVRQAATRVWPAVGAAVPAAVLNAVLFVVTLFVVALPTLFDVALLQAATRNRPATPTVRTAG